MDAYRRARQSRRRPGDKADVNRIANPATHKPAVRGLLRQSFATDTHRDYDALRSLSLPPTGRSAYESGSRQRIISGNERRSCMDAARLRSDANMIGLPIHPGFYSLRPHRRNSYYFPPQLSGATTPRRIKKETAKKRRPRRGRRRQRSTTSASSSSSSSSDASSSTESSVEETIRVKRSHSPRAKEKSKVETLEQRLVEVEKLRREAEAKAEQARHDLKQAELRELYMKQMDAKGAPRPADEPRVIFPSSPSRLVSRGSPVRSPRPMESTSRIQTEVHTTQVLQPAPLTVTPPAPPTTDVALVHRVPIELPPSNPGVTFTSPPTIETRPPSPAPVRYLSSWESLPQPAWSQQPRQQNPLPPPSQLPPPAQIHQPQHTTTFYSNTLQVPQQRQALPRPVQETAKEMIPVAQVQPGVRRQVMPPSMPALSPLAAAYGYLTDPNRPLPPREILPDSLAPSSRSHGFTSAFGSSGVVGSISPPMLTDTPNRRVDTMDTRARASPRSIGGTHRVTVVTNERKESGRDEDSSDIISSRQVAVTAAFHPPRPIVAAPSTQGDASRFVDGNIPDVRGSVSKMGSAFPATKAKKAKNRKGSRCGC